MNTYVSSLNLLVCSLPTFHGFEIDGEPLRQGNDCYQVFTMEKKKLQAVGPVFDIQQMSEDFSTQTLSPGSRGMDPAKEVDPMSASSKEIFFLRAVEARGNPAKLSNIQ